MARKSAAAAAVPEISKSEFIRKQLKAKRKNPLTYPEIRDRVVGAGYKGVYRSEVKRIMDGLAGE